MSLPEPFYDDGNGIVIYNADCRVIIPRLENIELVLTDPPYGTEMLTGGYGRAQNHGGEGRTINGDKCLTMASEGLAAVRKQMTSGYVLAFCAPRRMQEAFHLVPSADYMGELVWDKGTPGLGYTVRYTHESALLWKVGEPRPPECPLLSLVREQVNHFNTQARHPHEKPVSFWINALNLPGNVVVDPFMGSGNVLRAAKDMGRKAIGIETDKTFCEMAVENLRQEAFQL